MSAMIVEDLWQSYRDKQARPPTLKLTLADARRRRRRTDRWALRGVSFTVEPGEMLSVIGHNGSGKSTLLRSLAGIYRPVRGKVTVRGRTASLIDLTAGFHRLLTARQNVILGGAIYGLPRTEVLERLDAVFEFAGLKGEEETHLRAFSTGMAMRLGFSIAVAFDPDVLLVDEVLAVGDEAFKLKCLDKVRDLRNDGATVVFVSHELAIVRSLSDRVIVLDEGQILYEGEPDAAIEAYCAHLGVDVETALSRPLVQQQHLDALDSRWGKRRSRRSV